MLAFSPSTRTPYKQKDGFQGALPLDPPSFQAPSLRCGLLSAEPGSGIVKAMMNQPQTGENTMANNNTVILTGNLGEDPKQYTKDGKSFVRLSLATTDSYKDKTGNWKQQKPLWHTIFVSVEKAQNAALGFKKGNRIKVTGSLSYRRHQSHR